MISPDEKYIAFLVSSAGDNVLNILVQKTSESNNDNARMMTTHKFHNIHQRQYAIESGSLFYLQDCEDFFHLWAIDATSTKKSEARDLPFLPKDAEVGV